MIFNFVNIKSNARSKLGFGKGPRGFVLKGVPYAYMTAGNTDDAMAKYDKFQHSDEFDGVNFDEILATMTDTQIKNLERDPFKLKKE